VLHLPVTIDADRVAFSNAHITTDHSNLQIDGTLENLSDPKTSAHIKGSIALSDVRSLANVELVSDMRGLPQAVDMDISATYGGNVIDVTNSRIAFGDSSIEANGRLQDPNGRGALNFQAQLALAELGRIAKLDMKPEGIVTASGVATMDAQKNYDVQAAIGSHDVSFLQGAQRIRDVSITSGAHVTPQRIDLTGFRIGALGAEVTGNAKLEQMAHYSVNAELRRLDILTLLRDMGQKNAGYSGNVSGPLVASGDLKTPGMKSLTANAHLTIAPGRQGVPVSGRINADFRGDSENLIVGDSYIALPHTRLTIAGAMGNRLNVALNTTDLGDFTPVLGSAPPVVLGGPAAFTGAVTGKLSAPQINGHLAVGRFIAQGRQFDGVTADVAANSARAAVTAATLQRGPMQAQFTATVGLANWNPTPNQPLTVQAAVRNGDLADVMALAGQPPAGYSGALTADINVNGTVGNPQGAADLAIANGTLHGEPVDSVRARVNMADQLVTVTNTEVVAGPSRVTLAAELRHPHDRFDRGQLHAHVQSSQLDLSRIKTVQSQQPNSAGVLQLTADITGELRDGPKKDDSEFMLTNVTADASGRGLKYQGQPYGDFTTIARTNGQAVTYNVSSNFAGSQIRVDGNTQLATGYRTNADGSISGLAIEKALAAANQTGIPAKGTLTATFHVNGTIDKPEGTLDATIDRGVIYDEPVDRVHAKVTYLADSIDVPQLEVRSPGATLDATARFDHPAGSFDTGSLQFRITNGRADLAKVHTLQTMRPGLAGVVQLTGNGAGTLRNGEPRIQASNLNVNLSAKGIAASGKNLGDLTLTADTSGGRVNFVLDSNLANSTIQGRGNAQLTGDIPVTAQVSFKNVTWKGLQPLFGPVDSSAADFDAIAEGDLNLTGPILKTDALNGRLQLTKLEATATTPGHRNQSVTIANQGPIVVAMDRGVARIQNLHLTGPQTDIQAQGSASLIAQTLDGSVNAHVDVGLLQRFKRDMITSGQIVADATLRGTFAKPLVNGKVELQKVSINVADVPTGLSNASGVVEFTGASASFRDLKGEVGGGNVVLSGYANYTDALRLGLRVNATRVRYRLQPGVSAVADANIRFTGRLDASVIGGTVTLTQITYAPQSDIGAILSRAAPPVQSAGTPNPLLDNMKLDVRVRTSSATSVQAAVAQNLQVDANLHIQGTAAQPGVVGRITINEGKLVFFSSTYTVNTGTIAFYNPLRVEPVLDLSLATTAKSVNVTLRVTGSIDNMKLSYTSDPPLQFQEIATLLAAGTTPTSDPTLLANQPAQPQQSFQQMGESTILSKGLADPISNRLQRVFGVSQFRIDPTFTGDSALPQAQLTLSQQVTSRITLNYSTALDNPSAQNISGDFSFSRQWSATATRDQYGLFSVKFQFKKSFQ
jgi:translocation and assembly module TamB